MATLLSFMNMKFGYLRHESPMNAPICLIRIILNFNRPLFDRLSAKYHSVLLRQILVQLFDVLQVDGAEESAPEPLGSSGANQGVHNVDKSEKLVVHSIRHLDCRLAEYRMLHLFFKLFVKFFMEYALDFALGVMAFFLGGARLTDLD